MKRGAPGGPAVGGAGTARRVPSGRSTTAVRWRRGLGLAALCALSLACAGDGSRVGPPRAGDPLPPMTAVDLDGDTVALERYRGQGLLLNLWATWCPPCRAEMPYLQQLADRYRERGLRVVGISLDDRGAWDLVREFLGESGVSYDILLDPAMTSMDQLGVLGLPATFLVDPDGIVRHLRNGPVAEGDETFLAQVESVLPGATGEGS